MIIRTECRNTPDCNEAFPNLEERFLNLLESLNQNPVMLDLKDPVSGKEFSYALNGDYSTIINQLGYSMVPNYFADGLGLTIFTTEAGFEQLLHIPF